MPSREEIESDQTVRARPGVAPESNPQPTTKQHTPFAPGELVDDYIVGEVLGEGGMGIVLSARDPDLDRAVALKVLRRGVFGADVEAARARLLREAQAMAKLSHPNVITVYRIGAVGDHVFIAMELVEGGTLRDWLAKPRGHGEILETFRAAGRGLAAAHAAGLVHRDFKPDNVLVGHDGRVRVTDFGLVTTAEEPASAGDGAPPTTLALTNTGAVLGTPAYMAPEQHAGEPADARADQFAFCVALYEALYGQRPFAGETYAELVANVRATNVRRPASDLLPSRLRGVLIRGLARDPDKRYASMTDLLAALDGAPSTTIPPPESDARRAARELYVKGTAQARSQNPSDAVATLRQAATAAARAGDAVLEAEALTELLHAVVSALGEPQRAEDLLLATQLAVTRANADHVSVRFEIVAAELEQEQARYATARAHYETAIELWKTRCANDRAHFQLGASAHANYGSLLATLRDADGARDMFARARAILVDALGPDHAEVAYAVMYAGRIEYHLGELDRAHALLTEALAMLRRTHGETHAHIADAYAFLGDLHLFRGELAEGLGALAETLAIRRRLYGNDHLAVASGLLALGLAETNAGIVDAGRAHLDEGVRIRAALVPANHPDLAVARGQYAVALEASGDLAGAVAALEGAVAIFREHGLVHEIAKHEHALAKIWIRQSDLARALPHLERADEAWHGAHVDLDQAANTRFHLAHALWETGAHDRALDLAESIRAPHRDALAAWLAERGRP